MSNYEWTSIDLVRAVCQYLYGGVADTLPRVIPVSEPSELGYRWSALLADDLEGLPGMKHPDGQRWVQRWMNPIREADIARGRFQAEPKPEHISEMLRLVVERWTDRLPAEEGDHREILALILEKVPDEEFEHYPDAEDVLGGARVISDNPGRFRKYRHGVE